MREISRHAYNIWKSVTDFVKTRIEGVIDNDIGEFQREKSERFSAAALYASDPFFSHSSRLSSFSSIENIVLRNHVIIIYLNFITLFQEG